MSVVAAVANGSWAVQKVGDKVDWMRKEGTEIQNGYARLISEAYSRYKTFWINLAKNSSVSAEDGEDIVHTIIGSLLGREAYPFESVEHVRNYVARAVLNRSIQARQRTLRTSELNEEVFPDTQSIRQLETIEQKEEQAALRSAIGKLSNQDFEIIKLRFYSGLTFLEISKMLSIPISTLKSREDAAIRRIRKGIRKEM